MAKLLSRQDNHILVTAALPYANGSIHIGHLLEYISTDIFVRALRLLNKDVLYICADDTHGTPIQVNAMKQGISPRELILKSHKEHYRDLTAFEVSFDNFYLTDSPENQELVYYIYNEALKKGLIYKKEVEQLYCEHDKMFLPDRLVRGTCPVCGAESQYGDVCEKCGAVYNATDLINPKCAICGAKPVIKKSNNYFFKLSALSNELKDWLLSNPQLPKEIVNSMMTWINKGLKDWAISRPKPYFGFPIPNDPNNFFYVWFDAPIGYIASTKNYCDKHGRNFEDYWKSDRAKIIHVIGKDITYFHFLFWPALLISGGFSLPYAEVVHGFVNINGEKMSKSRGTFITASRFLSSKVDPEFLRFYFAVNLSRKLSDINLDFEDFKEKINSNLIGNIANFSYRVLSFTNKNFNSEITDFEFKNMQEEVLKLADEVVDAYLDFNLSLAVKKILEISDIGNKFFQDNAPWKMIKDRSRFEEAHRVVSFTVGIVKILSILLKPILPNYSRQLEVQLGCSDELNFSDINFNLPNKRIGKAKIVIRKLDKEFDEFLEKNHLNKGNNREVEKMDNFSKVDLRVAVVKEVSDHPNADKLYVLKIGLGDEERQLVAGLKKYYKPEELIGKHIIIVANLKHAKLRGVESQGMLLAADNGEAVKVLEAPNSRPGSSVFVEGIEKTPVKELNLDEFLALGLKTISKQAVYLDKPLRTDEEIIRVDMPDGSKIR